MNWITEKLQINGLLLITSLEIIEDIQETSITLCGNTDSIVCYKLINVLKKISSLSSLKPIFYILSGKKNFNFGNLLNELFSGNFTYFKHAFVKPVNVKCSFSTSSMLLINN